ncbi:MAG: ribosomal-protein-alanine acetyltransferase [Fibrobacteria bacterium]|jgi:ribosomal-protein-alanine N-acetyltransferase|nr:ribosomal-protein-alanine acetyltransferase [Fibrobacteria bacterium]
MTATVRSFVTVDAPAVAMLEALCNPLPWHLEDLLPFADPEPSSFVRLGLVALDERGRVLGYLLASSVAGQAEILVLGVHPDARRQGLARALLRGLFARLQTLEADSIFLEVRAGNRDAITLYKSLGFADAGVRKGYYADSGEDAVLLRREL